MKQIVLYTIFIVYLSQSSCIGEERVVLFDGSISARMDLPTGLNTIETHYFIVRDVPTFFQERAANASVNVSDVKGLQSGRGLLRATFEPVDFRFIEKISIYATSQTNPELKREMYYLDFVPYSIGEELKMLSATSDLKEILSNDFVDLEIRINFREFNTRTIPLTIDLSYTAF
jgi:hypothetical protein